MTLKNGSVLLFSIAAYSLLGAIAASNDEGDIRNAEETGFAFAGSAFLIFYYFGVIDVLSSNNVIDPTKTHFGGISGGSITTTAFCAGIPMKDVHEAFKKLLTECTDSWNQTTQMFPCDGQLYDRNQAGLRELLPPTSDAYKTCSGRLNLAVSKLNSTADNLDDTTPMITSEFESMDDLYLLLGATSFLSCQAAFRPYTIYKDSAVMDGGYGTTFDDICPNSTKRCVKVEAFYPGPYIKEGPCGATDPGNATPNYNDTADIKAPFEPIGNLPTTCPSQPKFTEPGPADIFPGNNEADPLNMTCAELQQLAYFPQVDKFDFLFELGQKDATYWLSKNAANASYASSASFRTLSLLPIIIALFFHSLAL